MSIPVPIKPLPGQESVWHYPRPPRLEAVELHIQIHFGGLCIVDTPRCHRVLETSHPPVYYIAPSFVRAGALRPAKGTSFCEWKGEADYFDVVAGDRTAARAAWCYAAPTPSFAAIAGFFAFYAAPMDRCSVGGERVTPQPGRFYGGWITSGIVGPFKGEPGSVGW
ncbi:DUF427 domain-containing protein [Devosia chinhatensis]|uniref:DUF427 domain-containing protein n=1 Tax=Devosia chinhatensis TaxID=429727 RepID=A0A0F5FK24_9HYPH|nr:DUF427 domain-containing protein [Devosia chinhatensis]KKB08930.1 hypothetical protein VE26_02450 [Devosia chinhatensis]